MKRARQHPDGCGEPFRDVVASARIEQLVAAHDSASILLRWSRLEVLRIERVDPRRQGEHDCLSDVVGQGPQSRLALCSACIFQADRMIGEEGVAGRAGGTFRLADCLQVLENLAGRAVDGGRRFRRIRNEFDNRPTVDRNESAAPVELGRLDRGFLREHGSRRENRGGCDEQNGAKELHFKFPRGRNVLILIFTYFICFVNTLVDKSKLPCIMYLFLPFEQVRSSLPRNLRKRGESLCGGS